MTSSAWSVSANRGPDSRGAGPGVCIGTARSGRLAVSVGECAHHGAGAWQGAACLARKAIMCSICHITPSVAKRNLVGCGQHDRVVAYARSDRGPSGRLLSRNTIRRTLALVRPSATAVAGRTQMPTLRPGAADPDDVVLVRTGSLATSSACARTHTVAPSGRPGEDQPERQTQAAAAQSRPGRAHSVRSG